MKTFRQWCTERKHDLAALTETPPEDQATTEGSTKRAAVRSHAYPPAYGRGQYPPEYFPPTAADAISYNKDAK